MNFTIITDVIRNFFAAIDSAVYFGIELLISLFDSLAKIRFFDEGIIKMFSDKVYVFVSIIMIFKVSFSIIQYIINPSIFSDSEKGFGKVIQNVLITLVAIVAVPHVFTIAYNVQDKVLENKIIESLVLGIGEEELSKEEQEKLKKRIPFALLRSFIFPNVEVPNVSYDINQGYMINGQRLYDEKGKVNPNLSINISNDQFYYKPKNYQYYSYDTFNKVYPFALKNYDLDLLLKVINAKNNVGEDGNSEVYVLTYRLVLSTAAGVFVLILYLNFCIDLAIRCAKLGFLQLMAPIPIISMIDPKSSKSGMMSKWAKSCISAYLGVFVRVAVVNFAIFVIDIVMNREFIGPTIGQGETGMFLDIVVLMGALLFAKELPKLITDLTGFDLKGSFNLNPFKRVVEGTPVGALGTAAVGGLSGAAAGAMAKAATGKHWYSKVGGFATGLVGGALGGTVRGLTSGVNNKGQNFIKNGRQVGQDIGSTIMRTAGSSNFGRTAASIQQSLGLQTKADRYEDDMKHLEEYSKTFSKLNSIADVDDTNFEDFRGQKDFFEFIKVDMTSVNSKHKNIDMDRVAEVKLASQDGIKGLKKYVEALENSGASQADILFAKDVYESARKRVIDDGGTGKVRQQIINEKAIAASYAKRYELDKKYGITATASATASEIGAAYGQALSEISNIKVKAGYQKAVINREAAKNNKK